MLLLLGTRHSCVHGDHPLHNAQQPSAALRSSGFVPPILLWKILSVASQIPAELPSWRTACTPGL